MRNISFSARHGRASSHMGMTGRLSPNHFPGSRRVGLAADSGRRRAGWRASLRSWPWATASPPAMACPPTPPSPRPAASGAAKPRTTTSNIDNAGVSGDTSGGRWSGSTGRWATEPTASIVEIGANDMLRGLDPEHDAGEYRRHPGAICASAKFRSCWPGCAPRRIWRPRLCRANSIRSIPISPKNSTRRSIPSFSKASPAKTDRQLPDGLHPTRRGVETIVAGILARGDRRGSTDCRTGNDGVEDLAAAVFRFRNPARRRGAAGLFSRRPVRRALGRAGGLSRHPALFRRHRRAHTAQAIDDRSRSRRKSFPRRSSCGSTSTKSASSAASSRAP